MKLRLDFEGLTTEIQLQDTDCAKALYEACPFEAVVHRWGEEIYFETPVTADLDETAVEVVKKGDVGYWPSGQALCLFFGPTPISEPGEIRPASAVNIVGQILSALDLLDEVPEGSRVLVEKAD